ncbi:MAG: hypothetical protein AAGI54_04650 [Planctomycetota bacterium]
MKLQSLLLSAVLAAAMISIAVLAGCTGTVNKNFYNQPYFGNDALRAFAAANAPADTPADDDAESRAAWMGDGESDPHPVDAAIPAGGNLNAMDDSPYAQQLMGLNAVVAGWESETRPSTLLRGGGINPSIATSGGQAATTSDSSGASDNRVGSDTPPPANDEAEPGPDSDDEDDAAPAEAVDDAG